MSETIEQEVIAGLIRDENFARATISHLKPDYFQDVACRTLFDIINVHFEKYKKAPSLKETAANLRDRIGSMRDDLIAASGNRLGELDVKTTVDTQWLTDRTEKFCKDRAIYNAVASAASIAAGEDKKRTPDAIPELLRDALNVSFDTRIGHDYFDDAEKRWESYTQQVQRLKFRIRGFNEISRGGLPNKTLTVPLSGTNVGKSAVLCAWAADWLADGHDVLYISNEMSEEMIGERIDANLLQIKIDDLEKTSKEWFAGEIAKLKRKTSGKLIVHEYPTRTASVRNFRKLLKELLTKLNFRPRVILVDYVNNMLPATVRPDANSYERIKAITEELRGLAMEFDVPIIAPTQTTRCLAEDTIIISQTRGEIEIKDVQIGECILGETGFKPVTDKWNSSQRAFEIVTRSGKRIVCSERHQFPTCDGLKTISSGLKTGNSLYVEQKQSTRLSILLETDEIISIREIGDINTVDIELHGDNSRLFFANGILTHNSGQNNSDVSLEEVSESHGLSQTADLIFALIRTEQLRESGQILIKQLKNRLGSMSKWSKFIVGFDFERMTMYETEDQSGAGFEDKAVFDRSESGIRIKDTEEFAF